MIALTFNAFFMLYLATTLTIVLGIWIYSHYRMKQRLFFSTEHTLFICEYCHFTYLEEDIKSLNRCPQCSLLNKDNAYQKNINN